MLSLQHGSFIVILLSSDVLYFCNGHQDARQRTRRHEGLQADRGKDELLEQAVGPATPELPTVQGILGKATSSATVAEQARLLQKSFVEKQREAEERLQSRRKDFEGILLSQAVNNNNIEKANDEMRRAISNVQRESQVASHNVNQIHRGNELLRSAASMLEGKMAMAAEFVQELVRNSGDADLMKSGLDARISTAIREASKQSNQATSSKVGFEELLAEAQVDKKARTGASLLQEGPLRPGLVVPPDLTIRRLADSFNNLVGAAVEGERTLNASFSRAAQDGESKHRTLLAEHAALNQSLGKELSKKNALHQLEDHMIGVRRNLNERLRGLRIFLRRADALVDVTTKQAASMGQIVDDDLLPTDMAKQPNHITIPQASMFIEHEMSPLSKAVVAASKEAAAAKQEAEQNSAEVAKAATDVDGENRMAEASTSTTGSPLSNTMSWFFKR